MSTNNREAQLDEVYVMFASVTEDPEENSYCTIKMPRSIIPARYLEGDEVTHIRKCGNYGWVLMPYFDKPMPAERVAELVEIETFLDDKQRADETKEEYTARFQRLFEGGIGPIHRTQLFIEIVCGVFD